jgi:hypothetical protein
MQGDGVDGYTIAVRMRVAQWAGKEHQKATDVQQREV